MLVVRVLIDVEENLTIGAAGSPSCVATGRHLSATVIVVEIDIAAILTRAGVGVTRTPSGLEFASRHPLCGSAYVKWEPCQWTFGYGGATSVTNANPEPWFLSVLSREVGVGPQTAGLAGDKQARNRPRETGRPKPKVSGDGIGTGSP